MRILMQNRSDCLVRRGGDTVQMEKTAESLRRLGLEVRFSSSYCEHLADCDLVHVFNLSRPDEVYGFVKNAERQGKPIVISTIYWNFDEVNREGRTGLQALLYRFVSGNTVNSLRDFVRTLGRDGAQSALGVCSTSHKARQREILQKCSVWLPNSMGELNEIEMAFGMRNHPYAIIPNGIDRAVYRYGYSRENRLFDDDFALCVGLFHARKNHVPLLKAIKLLKKPLVLVGEPGTNQTGYVSRVHRELRGMKNVKVLPPQAPAALAALYHQAKVHALPSWLETPGLVHLEAFACGCNVVASRRGSTPEYMGENAFYCEPNSLKSIAEAIDAAFVNPRGCRYTNSISERYNWEEAAKATHAAYENAMNTHNRR